MACHHGMGLSVACFSLLPQTMAIPLVDDAVVRQLESNLRPNRDPPLSL